jgi:hypothetical protein
MEKTNKQSENIFAQIILEQAHIGFINDRIDDIYDKIGEFTENEDAELFFLNNEKTQTKNRIEELKMEYTNAIKEESKTFSGKIEIEYDGISNDTLWELYRYLNRWVYNGEGKVSYHTVENNMKYSLYESESFSPSEKYSKDFTNEDPDKKISC